MHTTALHAETSACRRARQEHLKAVEKEERRTVGRDHRIRGAGEAFEHHDAKYRRHGRLDKERKTDIVTIPV